MPRRKYYKTRYNTMEGGQKICNNING